MVNPRQGKFAKLVPAISLYLGYFILLNAAKFAVEDGKIPPSIGLWWIHLSALFIGSLLIIKVPHWVPCLKPLLKNGG